MTIGATPDNQMVLLAASVVGFVALPLVIWLLVTVFGLVGRILGIRAGLPGVVFLIAVPGALLAGSLALDRSGVVRPAQVIDKRENVVVHSNGGWRDNLTLTVRYSPGGAALPKFTSSAAALIDAMNRQNLEELAVISPGAADFDRLHPGDSLDVRIVRVGTLLSIVRPANQSTDALIPWNLVEDALAAAALVYLAWRLRKTPLGYWPLAGLLLLALCVPPVIAYQTWQVKNDLSNATMRADATVGQVTHLTEVDLGTRGRRSDRIKLLQPYDVVQLTFVPPHYPDPIIAVDAVDATSEQATEFTTGSHVEVVYPPGNPRDARVLGQARTHYLKTTLAIYENYALLILLIVVLAFIGGAISRAWRGLNPRNRILTAIDKASEEWESQEKRT